MEDKDRSVIKALTMITQIGITIATSIAISFYIGYRIDKWLSTQYWVLIMLVVGSLAALKSVHFLTKGFYEKDLKEEKKEIEYLDNLRKEGQKKKDSKQK